MRAMQFRPGTAGMRRRGALWVALRGALWGALWAAAIGMSMAAGAAAPATPLPPDSIYQLALPLADQNGRSLALGDYRGRPLLISMFYSSCQFVCPRIVESLKRTQSALPAELSTRVPVLMVSFDSARDDSAALKAMATERNLDERRWTLAHADARSVRKLAALLGVQYRELPSGEFNHTSVLILLDAEGRIAGKSFLIGEADPVFIKLVKKHASAGAGSR